MKRLKLIIVLCICLVPLWAASEPCPLTPDGGVTTSNTLNPDEDFDGDGILNEDDPCCFVFSLPGDLTNAMCKESDDNIDPDNRDLNGNGISAADENAGGSCCITFDSYNGMSLPGTCRHVQVVAECTEEYRGFVVDCDKLLLYNGIIIDQESVYCPGG